MMLTTCFGSRTLVSKIMRRMVVAAFAALWLCTIGGQLRAANVPEDPLLRALKEELERSKAKLKMDNVAAPYYIEYRVTDLDDFEANAAFGALRSEQRGRGRFLRVVVRIGDYKQDSYYGGGQGTVDLVPLDDDDVAIRHRLWLATDRAYKAAGEALSAKQSVLQTLTIDQPVDDFAQATPVELIEPITHLPAQDFTPWVHLLEESSDLYRSDLRLEDFETSLRFVAQNTYFVNSEGTVARTGTANYSIVIAGTTQAADGQFLQRSHQDEATDLNGLPTREQFLKTSARILETLKLLREAPLVDEEYRGPILFSSDAGASVVSSLIEPNLLGTKPKLGENARTTGFWSSSYNSRVLPEFVNVFDDPTISSVPLNGGPGRPLFGHYALDDEGVGARRVSLIEKGKLVSYLVGRQPIRDFAVSNGHGRAAPTDGPGPQPGNFILETTNPQSEADLKKKLLDLARQRGLPYALYVETTGPRLEPRLLYRIYTNDGHEELVRGGVFGDLDVRSLRRDLIAAGKAPDIETHLESVPYSVVSPALLFDELQVKRTQASKQALPEYPAPPLTPASH
jgi:predicted Zn-dependent protease